MGKFCRTPDGVGILIAVDMPVNGLYYQPELSRWTVFYGTDHQQSGKVVWQYNAEEIFQVRE